MRSQDGEWEDDENGRFWGEAGDENREEDEHGGDRIARGKKAFGRADEAGDGDAE